MLAWVLLIVALMFAAFFRGRMVAFPLERDEGEYAYAGQLLLQGIPPYCLAYSMKLPGTYLAYAAIMAVFGQTPSGIHLGLLVVNLATIGLLFLLARALFDDLTAGVAAVVFAVLSTSSTVLGLAAHATHFVTLFGIAGVWVLWRALRSEKPTGYFAAGLLLGLAFVMKQPGMFLACFGGLVTLLSAWGRRPFVSRPHAVRCLAYAVGALLPLAAVCLWLWQAGVFGTFWFWIVDYAQTYARGGPLPILDMFWWNIKLVIGNNWPLWTMAMIGAIALAVSRDVPSRRMFVFGFFVFSFLCVCPGFYFRDHYFIVLLPALAILAGWGAVALIGLFRRLGFDRLAASRFRLSEAAAALVVAAVVVAPVWQQRDYYFRWLPWQACRVVYGTDPFVEAIAIGDYLKSHAGPNDQVAVLGSEPEVYFYAQRHSATGYIYIYPLGEPHPFAHAMQEELIRQVELARPAYLVCINISTSWVDRPDADITALRDWLIRYVGEGYHLVGLIEIFRDAPTEYKWDADVANVRPRSQSYLTIFRRNP
jgi:4-amino-4-deoxy-L-arabinose transferase-like glycosyltransferase